MENKKNKIQISQILCFFSMGLAFYCINLSGILSFLGREPLSDITITVIGLLTTVVNIGYFALSGARDCSRNKHANKLKNESENII